MGYSVVDSKGKVHEVPLEVEAAGAEALEQWCKKHVTGYPFPVKADTPPKEGAKMTITPNPAEPKGE